VYRGEIGKEGYIEESIRLEHQAMIMARKFIEGHCFTFRNASSDDYMYQHIVSCPSSFKEFVTQGRHYRHMEYFEKIYNQKVLPYLQSGGVLPRERDTMITEKIRWKRKRKFLRSLDWAMSVLMLSAMGFIVGSCYPEPVCYIPSV
jgi:hypothetical protein